MPTSTRRIRVTVAYDGFDYSGWQVQPGRRTIQGILEEIIEEIEGKRVHVGASGRTDAGVHALAQVAAFDLDNPIPCENLRKAINRLLPPDIRILRAEEVQAGFNARHDAIAKTYEYRIFRGEICSPFERRYVCHHPFIVDEDRMSEFAKVRTIFSSRGESRDGRWIYRVRGSGFLKHMVRNIVGVLLEVGKGNLSREQVLARLEAGSGIRPGPTSPPQGLYLESVEYPGEMMDGSGSS
jgi:tRNA pseudouridine38-40 synthase